MKHFDAEDATDPIALFRKWMAEASETELNDPEAVALATATTSGTPSVRMVLMKRLDERGFSFYTNDESQKGRELAANPHAAMCFHWKSLARQIRIEGKIHDLPVEDADTYFQTRSRGSRLSALASKQSRPVESRDEMEARVRTLAEWYPEAVPLPEHWRGFVLEPANIEFWQQGDDRLHDRVVFTRGDDGWAKQRLFP